ncbi:hypothetical protein PRIPAC_82923 [Pristionchus pacificus]|uniref:G protein-coupled receptor n=1 Tax=Pristionchus pacificus TaxID=54126 RepID=A0A2A6C369_PRIPA|nr:hypothetical protein PRIPAC_82923 [Pristionchus pacificus]|eukprot:PDM72576.1 G protein-coupled receptor [Pristionchus pacificus]
MLPFTAILSIFMLIGVPANSILMLAIIVSTTREIKAYSIIQFNISLFDLIRITSEFMAHLPMAIHRFYLSALGGWLPGPCLVRSMLFILPSPILIYMCTFYTISESDSASVILSHHPHENITSLIYVGMSADDVTPMLFTVSTLTFPIPAYITISYYCIKLLKTIAQSTTMSFKTKRMHESFMKALLYTTIQPTLLFAAILITFAQNLKIFEATAFTESLITLNEMRSFFGSRREFDAQKVDKGDEKKWTWAEWKRPVIAVILTFLCNVESSMLAVGEWPYMNTIDHEGASAFYGIAVAVSKAGHAVFAFVFAIWAYKISGIRIPMLVGRLITLTACIMYIFVEFIPVNRRWWMFSCYLLIGIGFGTSPLLRSYIARHTSEENRSTAYALQNGAGVLSVIVGPLAQICFSGLPYPGARIIYPNINLNIFTAPIWFAIITNIIALVLIIVCLDDPKDEEETKEEKTPIFSLAAICERFSNLRSLHLPWILIALVIFEKVVSDLATSSALAGPVMTVMYALSGQNTVLVVAVSQVIVGVLALALSLLFFLCKLGRYVSCRVLFIFSTIVVIIGYIITYPFPFSSDPLKPFNETTRTGCNPQEYSWCDTQLAVNLVPYIIILIITNSFAIPAAGLSLDTIYSKMIGKIDQNLMQSLFVIADDIVQIVGPIYGAEVFSAVGLNLIHIINGIVYIVGTIVWLIGWRWLRKYN